MGKIIAAISMSLDGFVTGPNVTRDQQLGDGGEVLQQWVWTPAPVDAELLEGMQQGAGAVLMGRRSYDLAEGDGGWDDGGPVGPVPCFVLTHRAPEPETVRARAVFTFVTDGLHSALAQAQAVAGDKVIGVHGASAAQQCLSAGLMDELRIHLVPVLLGSGTRLFDHLGGPVALERTEVLDSPNATHLHYRVINTAR